MVCKCCVTNFTGSHSAEKKLKMFPLPQNYEETKNWIIVIPREKIPYSVVFEGDQSKHYPIITDY